MDKSNDEEFEFGDISVTSSYLNKFRERKRQYLRESKLQDKNAGNKFGFNLTPEVNSLDVSDSSPDAAENENSSGVDRQEGYDNTRESEFSLTPEIMSWDGTDESADELDNNSLTADLDFDDNLNADLDDGLYSHQSVSALPNESNASDDYYSENELSDNADASNNDANEVAGKGVWSKFFIITALCVISCVVLWGYYNSESKNSDDNLNSEPVYEVNISPSDYGFVSLSDMIMSSMSSKDITAPTTKSTDDSNKTTSSKETTATKSTKPSKEYKKLSLGDSGEEVKTMQQRLCKLGYIDEKSCTGYYGKYTVNRVKSFQRLSKLPETGVADAVTLEKLYSDDAPYCK